jgi:DNA-binding transcriptional ArsR family regulator
MLRPSVRTTTLARAAPVFSALGDATRLGIVASLCSKGPQSISQLTASADVTRQAVTRHLDVLADAGLVHDVRRGRERIWDLDTKRLDEAIRYLDRISRQWDEALSRLKALVEE